MERYNTHLHCDLGTKITELYVNRFDDRTSLNISLQREWRRYTRAYNPDILVVQKRKYGKIWLKI